MGVVALLTIAIFFCRFYNRSVNMEQYNINAQPKSRVNTNSLLKNAYLWMALGLAMTGVVAALVSANPSFLFSVYSSFLGLFLVVGIQFGLVIFLSSRLHTMKVSTAVICFMLYSAVTGFSLSSIFLIYTGAVITRAFFSACLMFAGMGLFAMITKKNLNSWGSYLMMGFWGIIIASVINMIFRAGWLDYVISFIGVAVFLGLTAWDTQRIVQMGYQAQGADEDSYVKLSIISALTLYLDFLNIFLYLLRIFGRSNDN